MTYDFDMLAVTPKEFQRKYAGLLARFGLTDQARQQIAMFRDPRAAHALQGASEVVRDVFVTNGFAVNAYVTGIDEGKYRAADAAQRSAVLGRLEAALDALPEDVEWNGFDKDAFLASARAAAPLVRIPEFASTRQTVSTRVASRPLSTPAPSF